MVSIFIELNALSLTNIINLLLFLDLKLKKKTINLHNLKFFFLSDKYIPIIYEKIKFLLKMIMWISLMVIKEIRILCLI